MNIDGSPFRTIWLAADGWAVEIIDQTKIPFEFNILRLDTCDLAATAIRDMWVRGAPLIGATAAYGMALAMKEDPSDDNLAAAADKLMATRPTAVNLRWAIDAMRTLLGPISPNARSQAAYIRAAEICDEDVAICSSIGDNGMPLIHKAWEARGKPDQVNVLTHCNAG
ncbi:MAG: S-methyl-5-thioribose-1-phosphate isomerase, partial [Alphaproteobacteria bacterium]|nr:S-methyl-5-thioribose-1-phosphate isomerase [Alphaproteobacteria bacterium]